MSVDEETGRLTVEHVHAAVYAGRVVNRAGAELQNEGSMLMGLGTTLFEAVEFADGQVTNANLSDYNVPAFGDLPQLTHELIERDGAEVHGLGETALPPVPPAIGNALASLGAHVTELPITAERVLEALRAMNGRRDPQRPRRHARGAQRRDAAAGAAPPRPAVRARDLRDRRLRRLHRAARRRAGVRLPDADGGRPPAARSPPSRGSTRPIPCCARSTRRTPSSAAGARRASC